MSDQDLRILKTVRVLKSWAGVDHQTRRILHELCGLGYLEIVTRTKPRPQGAPERPSSYRLTERGPLATTPKLRIAAATVGERYRERSPSLND